MSISRISFVAPSSSSGHARLRPLRDLGGLHLDPGLLERGAHGGQVGRLAEDLEHVVVEHDVLGAGVDRDHQVVLGVALAVDHDDALLVEQVGDGAGLAEVAAVLGEGVADLGAGAVAVVGQRLDEDRDAAGAVALVDDGLERSASAPSPVPLAIARSMLSLGIEASLAFWTASASAGLPSRSPPPSFAATVIARASLVKSLPRRESTIAFLCLIPAHLE